MFVSSSELGVEHQCLVLNKPYGMCGVRLCELIVDSCSALLRVEVMHFCAHGDWLGFMIRDVEGICEQLLDPGGVAYHMQVDLCFKFNLRCVL